MSMNVPRTVNISYVMITVIVLMVVRKAGQEKSVSVSFAAFFSLGSLLVMCIAYL